jgi:hypothetical protein
MGNRWPAKVAVVLLFILTCLWARSEEHIELVPQLGMGKIDYSSVVLFEFWVVTYTAITFSTTPRQRIDELVRTTFSNMGKTYLHPLRDSLPQS